jgi:hypothetical protein
MAHCSIVPQLNKKTDQLGAAFDFATSFLFGDSFVAQTVELYKLNNDLKAVYASSLPAMSKAQVSFPGISGTIAEAWGQKSVDGLNACISIPLVPDPGFYFPAETNAGPTGDAWSDANSTLGYTQGDVAAALAKLQQVQNAQYAGLSSSVSSADFVKSAKKFYADTDAFWAKNAKEYSQTVYHPWYEKVILPALG